MLTRSTWILFACALALACHDEDPGFEIVRVPMSAYAMPDAGAQTDAASKEHAGDAAAGPLVVCVPKSDDEDDCPPVHEGRAYDEHVTTRHDGKGESVCCYRRGRLPHNDDGD